MFIIEPRRSYLQFQITYLICACVVVCDCVCGSVVISPRTFAGGRGLGNGKGCWRRVTSWAAASPMNRWTAGGAAGSPPSVQPPHPAARNPTACQRLGAIMLRKLSKAVQWDILH